MRLALASAVTAIAAILLACNGVEDLRESPAATVAGVATSPEPTSEPTAPPTAPPTPAPTLAPAPTRTLVPAPIVTQPPVETNCHPSYLGACLATNAGDYDCAGGSGNGPNYVRGPIQVVGPDVFDLDRDGDGIGCE